MVKIYKGVVVYQNIGNVIIPDAQVDDLKVNNIATINTLHVLDTLGLSSIKIKSGTVSKYALTDFDITNKKYVDDAVAAGGFDPTQPLTLTGMPVSLTIKGDTEIYNSINTHNINGFYLKNEDDETVGSLKNGDETIILSSYGNGTTITNNKLYLMNGSGVSLDDYNYNKGIKIDSDGIEIKGYTGIKGIFSTNNKSIDETNRYTKTISQSVSKLSFIDSKNNIYYIDDNGQYIHQFSINNNYSVDNVRNIQIHENAENNKSCCIDEKDCVYVLSLYNSNYNIIVYDLINETLQTISLSSISYTPWRLIHYNHLVLLITNNSSNNQINIYKIVSNTLSLIEEDKQLGGIIQTYYIHNDSKSINQILYIGTSEGVGTPPTALSVFDNNFNITLPNTIGSYTVSNKNITCMTSDYLGNIFIMPYNGRNKIIMYTNDKIFKVYDGPETSKDAISCCVDKNNNIYIIYDTTDSIFGMLEYDLKIKDYVYKEIEIESDIPIKFTYTTIYNDCLVLGYGADLSGKFIVVYRLNTSNIIDNNNSSFNDLLNISNSKITIGQNKIILNGYDGNITANNINLYSGTITKNAVNDNDIINKKYFDTNSQHIDLSNTVNFTYPYTSINATGEIKAGTITSGTGNNQIQLKTNGEITGKYLTLSEGINCGTIKAGSGGNQITLDTQTGGINGRFVATSGNITAGSSPNQITLNSSTGDISGKTLTLTNELTTTGLTCNAQSHFNYDLKLHNSKVMYICDDTGDYWLRFNTDRSVHSLIHSNTGTLYLYNGDNYYNSQNARGFKIQQSGIEVKGLLKLVNGGTTISPTNNNDIANKAYVDTVASQGFDPSLTLNLTNTNSLITDGDITSKTLYKTEKASNDITYTLKYTIDRNLNNPAGLFYCPSNNKLYTVKSGNLEASYIVIYDIATGTTTTKEITKENVSMIEVTSFNGFYNIYGYYNIPRDPYILITGNDSNNNSRYCYYDINSDTLSILRSTSPVDVQASAKISYNGWEYFYTDQANTTYNLYIKSRTDYYPGRTDIYMFNLSDPPKYLLPLNSEKQYFITLSSSKINLYRFNNSSTLITLDSYDTSNTTIKKIIYNNESDSCFVIGKNKVYKVDVVNDLLSVNLALDLSSDNSLTIYGGIVNYDGTLYLTSYSSTSPYTTYIQQYILTNGTLKLVSELARTNQKLTINYLVCAENKIYSVCKNANTNQYYSNIAEITTNKNSIISNNQTSLNGVLSINNSSTFNYNNNDILTVGMLIELLKNFTCVHGECLDMSYLQDNTFINSTKFINSC